VAGREAEEIVGQITDTTLSLISSNVDLVKRIAESRGAPDPNGRGPVQDIWMTWAQNAGDLVTISYLTAQLFDAFRGPGPSRPGE